jgi:cyclophilin family peptidyl-prolyl cis-trans isomerase
MEAIQMTCIRFLLAALALGMLPLAGCSSETSTSDVSASINGGTNDAGSSGGRQAPAKATVRIETSMGNIVVELDSDKAPLTVENFLSYVKRGQYDQTIFHQIVSDYIVLGGGFTSELEEKPTLTPVRNEAHNGLKNRRGTIGMARQVDSIDSSTCQFFINLADNEGLDHVDRTVEGYGYCVFGRVIEGLEVVDRISKVPVHDIEGFERIATNPVIIKTVKQIH